MIISVKKLELKLLKVNINDEASLMFVDIGLKIAGPSSKPTVGPSSGLSVGPFSGLSVIKRKNKKIKLSQN